jgi:APA family basic amino acid/polyamine antiporter
MVGRGWWALRECSAGRPPPPPAIPYTSRVQARSARRLPAILGVTFGLAVTIGNMIGVGILRAPGEIAQHLPTFWTYVAVWIVGGAYALLGANSLAELGAMTPRSGGQYVFVRRALGDYAGFVVGWSDWISTCGTTAAVAIVIGEYAIVLFPALRMVEIVALAGIAILTVVQWFGTRPSAIAQDLSSLVKAGALLMLVAACFILGSRAPHAAAIVADSEVSLFVAFILALQLVIYTYDGWTAVIYFSGEVKNPGRDIPRSMFGGVAAVIALYLLINLAFLRVVPLGTLAGQKLAAGTVARYLFGPQGDTVLRAVMVLALVSALNSNVLMAPRVIFAMAKDRLFWRGATEVNAGGAPDMALLISSALAVLFIVTQSFDQVIAKLAFFFVANYTLSFASLFVLRRRESNAERPFRAIGHPFTTGLALVASVVFLGGAVASDAKNSLWAVALLAISFPLYLLIRPRAAVPA